VSTKQTEVSGRHGSVYFNFNLIQRAYNQRSNWPPSAWIHSLARSSVLERIVC